MVRKILILTFMLSLFPTVGWSIDNVCLEKNDAIRYEEDDYDCLVQYREAFRSLLTLYRNNLIQGVQPPDNIVGSNQLDSQLSVQSISYVQPPDNITFRQFLLNQFYVQPPDN